MRALSTTLIVLALAFVLAACNRASEEECEAACLHYSKLAFAAEEELELGSPEFDEAWGALQERDELGEGLHHCVTLCQGAASAGQTQCILEAESAAAADDCSGVSRAKTKSDEP